MARLFYPGQPVMCVNDDFSWARRYAARLGIAGISYPAAGSRYVVRAYVPIPDDGKTVQAVLLVEIVNPSVPYINNNGVHEAGFAEERFVPVTDEQVRTIIEEANKMGPWTGGTHWDAPSTKKEKERCLA